MYESDVTAVITTSARHSNPDTTTVDECYAQVRKHFPNIQVLLLMDGVHPELTHYAERYEEFKAAIKAKIWENFTAVEFPEWQHRSGMLREAILEQGLVTTPLCLYSMDDTPLRDAEIDWRGIVSTLADGQFVGIRFETSMHWKETLGMMTSKFGVPIMRTKVYEGDFTQLVRMDYFQQLIAAYGQSKTFMEQIRPPIEWVRTRDNFPCGIYAPVDNKPTCYLTHGKHRGMTIGKGDWGHPYILDPDGTKRYIQGQPYRCARMD